MDVAVEHGHRPELLEQLERAGAVPGAPAPLLVHDPQRDVGEHHDRRRGRLALEVVGEPGDLLVTQRAEAAGLQVDHVDEADEVHAVLVEAVPAGALGVLAVALAVELDLFVDDVVLARHVVHVEAGGLDDAVGVVELLRLRQVGDVAGVDHELGLGRQRLHLGDRLLQRAGGVGIGGLVEADMAVADLKEGQPGRLCGQCRLDEAERAGHAA